MLSVAGENINIIQSNRINWTLNYTQIYAWACLSTVNSINTGL